MLANYNEIKTYVENIQSNVNNIVDEQMSHYLKKEVFIDTVTKNKDFVISNNTEIIFNNYYQVR